MAGPYRITWFFGWGENGWSENMYLDTADRSNAFTRGLAFMDARRELLSRNAFVEHMRVSDVDNVRDADFYTWTGNSGYGTFGTNAESDDDEISQAAINFRLFSGPTVWRSWLLRGLPRQAIIHDNTGAFVNARAETRLRKIRLAILENVFSIRKAAPVTWVPITGVGLGGRKIRSFQTDPAIAGLVDGDKLRVRLLEEVANSRGLWRVNVSLGGIITVYPKARSNQGVFVAGATFGQIGKQTYTYPAITDGVTIGVTSKKLGKRYYLPRGRRSVQRT